MKKFFEEPIVEVTAFAVEDIITTSGGGVVGGGGENEVDRD